MSRVVELKPLPAWRARVQDLLRAAYAEEAKLLGAADFPPARRTLADEEAGAFYGVIGEQGLAAVIELEQEEDALLIASLAVRPECFRRGYASELLGWLLETHQPPFAVATAADNLPATALYARFGFTEVGRRRTPDGLELVRYRLG